MNQMQQMIMQAQRMQRELNKAHEALNQKEFTVSKAGMVTVVVLGSHEVKSIEIDKDTLDPENAEMLSESIALALNEANEAISKESAEIDEKITGQKGNFPF